MALMKQYDQHYIQVRKDGNILHVDTPDLTKINLEDSGLDFRPKSEAGVGQWLNMGNTTSYTLPAGGQWAYCFVSWDTSGTMAGAYANIVSGGTVLSNSGKPFSGFAWRIA